jgi:hypothetical protein
VFVAEFWWRCFWATVFVFVDVFVGAIALHQVIQNSGTGGTILLV